ncbi:MAG: UDP-N-acetylmuramate--L-alanine ligase, partial [Actinomycetota bacterium]
VVERRSIVSELGAVHLIGVGGAGMSALAKVLLARGILVSGSDLKESADLAALRALGARISIGHEPSNIGDAETVVVSSAIRATNPELRAAEAKGVRVLHRAQLLGMLMRDRRGIAVAGTHGKTTTTSMIALILQRAGLDPTFLVGGEVNERGTNAHDGVGEWLVAEADESDGSFLWLGPEIAVVTSIEADHLDYYGTEADVRETFGAFMENVLPEGAIVACIEDAGVRSVIPRVDRRFVTYGLADGEWTANRAPANGGQEMIVRRHGAVVGTIALPVGGAHNALNALAAVAAATEVGVAFDVVADALGKYGGVRRRFERRGVAAGVTVIDDYAHNPSKVRAAIAAAREQSPVRLVAVFQPHLYSRTRHLGKDLCAALSGADIVVVTDVYGAREDPQPGITGKIVVDGLLDEAPRRSVAYLPKRGDIVPYVTGRARPGDLVLTIGAGDVTMLCDEILLKLEESARR